MVILDMARMPFGIESDAPGNYNQRMGNREKKLAEAIRDDENVNDDFQQAVVAGSIDQADGTAFTGAAAEVCALDSGKAKYEMYISSVATGAAVITPFHSSDGLECKAMAGGTGPDSYELGHGTTALSRAAYTVGSFPDADRRIFFEVTCKIDDISDVTEIWCGWRKAEAYQATDPDAYDEMACFNIGKDADGQIEIHTILNNAATSETDTTETDWADAGEHTLRIEVENDGKCWFYYDGSEPTVTADFSFDDGEVILPFFRIDTETGDPGISISSWKCGVK